MTCGQDTLAQMLVRGKKPEHKERKQFIKDKQHALNRANPVLNTQSFMLQKDCLMV